MPGRLVSIVGVRMTRCQGWCGLCYSNAKGRSNHKGHYRFQCASARRKVRWRVYPRPRPKSASDGPNLGALVSCSFGEQYPSLWAFLTDSEWEDGTERETGTLLVCVSEGRAKGWLNDRSEGRSCWVSSSTITGVLEAADAVLRTGEGDWRDTPRKRR